MTVGSSGYESLSRLDAAFLSFETPAAPMHVGLTLTFREGPLRNRNSGIDIARIRQHIEARLSRIPRYRQKVRKVPITGDLLWVDDNRFDLDHHVRHTSLPRPGGERELQQICADILERPLNRTRPLWEVWTVEGLEDGQFALVCKVHHCMVDGVGGLSLLQAMLSTSPVEPSGPPEPWTPRAEPSESDLLQIAMQRRQNLIRSAGETLRSALQDPQQTSKALKASASEILAFARGGLKLPSTGSFNQPIGPNRKIEWLSLDLARVKAIHASLDGTVNDVVLATLSGGFRRFLHGRGHLDDRPTLRTVIPVNVRAEGPAQSMGNQASCWMLDLPLQPDDPKEMLRRIRTQTLMHKSSRSARGGELLSEAAEWANAGIMHQVVRTLSNLQPYNLVITNVPGPPFPLFLAGAPLIAAHPHLPLFEGQGIGVAIFRYLDQLQIGLTGDRDQVPDLQDLTKSIHASFAALEAAAGTEIAQAMRAGAGAS